MTVNEDDRQFVAEYVLGTLPAALRMMVQARVAEEPEIAALALAWQQRLAPLHELAVPIAPPKDLWPEIAAVIAPPPPPDMSPAEVASGKAAASAALPEFALPETSDEDEAPEGDELSADSLYGDMVGGDASVGGTGGALVAPSRALSATGEAVVLEASRNRWRLAARILVLALLGVGGAFAYRELDRSWDQHYLATLQEGRAAAVLVRLDVRSGELAVRPLLDPAPEGKTYQLWLVPDGQPPRSLGTFTGAFAAKSDAIRRMGTRGAGKAMLQVTLEPQGGSDFGPTGDVVYSGRLLPE